MLDLIETERRQKIVDSKVMDLCVSYLGDDDIDYIIETLLPLYNDDFRHSYSAFYPIISMYIDSNSGDIDCLSYNLRLLRSRVYKKYSAECNAINIVKLCDHINLDASRYQQTVVFNTELRSVEARLDKSQKTLVAVSSDLSVAQKKLEKSQIDVITAMSIFSAVVLTFFGGVSYISSSISAVADAPLLKLSFLVILAGDIMYNIIIGVFSVLNRIIHADKHKPISLPVFITVNVVLLVILIAIIVSSFFLPPSPFHFWAH